MNYGPKANQRSCMYKMNHKFVIDTVKSKEKIISFWNRKDLTASMVVGSCPHGWSIEFWIRTTLCKQIRIRLPIFML